MKVVKYNDCFVLGDDLNVSLDFTNSVLVAVTNEDEVSIKQAKCYLSPVDAISLGKKLIEFGQEQIDNRETSNT